MKKTFFLLIVIMVILCGCKKNSLVGKWNFYDGNKTRTDISYTFNKDKTGTYLFMNNEQKITYEIEKETIKIKLDSDSKIKKYDFEISKGVLTLKDKNSESKYKKS